MINAGPGYPRDMPKDAPADPVWFRMIGGMQNYDAINDCTLDEPYAICRLDVLIGSQQFNTVLKCRRPLPPVAGKLLDQAWLPEPSGGSLRSVSMQVDKAELASKLRAIADAIEGA